MECVYLIGDLADAFGSAACCRDSRTGMFYFDFPAMTPAKVEILFVLPEAERCPSDGLFWARMSWCSAASGTAMWQLSVSLGDGPFAKPTRIPSTSAGEERVVCHGPEVVGSISVPEPAMLGVLRVERAARDPHDDLQSGAWLLALELTLRQRRGVTFLTQGGT